MTFVEQWHEQIAASLGELAAVSEGVTDIDFTYGIVATGVLWPLRQPVREYDGAAADAVRDLAGPATGRLLKLINAFPDDRLTAARLLADTAAQDAGVRVALDALIARFDALQIFAAQLAQHLANRYPTLPQGTTFNITEEIKAALVNIGGITNIHDLTVHLSQPLPPRRLSVPHKLGLGTAGILVLVGAVLVIVQFAQPLVAAPPPMTGGFNVAIAEFGKLDAQGRFGRSESAAAMADAVHRLLDTELASLKETSAVAALDIMTRGPAVTGRITGTTPEQRADAAADLAHRMGADVVFYGYLSPDNTTFVPEFYVSPRRLGPAEELIGRFDFGPQISSPTDITLNPAARIELQHQLRARTAALAQFSVGIGYYAMQQYAEAATYFQHVAAEGGLADSREVLDLFQGNVAAKLGDFDAARAFYNAALEAEPEYARARIGLANVVFEAAKGTCAPGATDAAGLQEALRLYQGALDAREQPLHADIGTKVAFGRGQVFACLTYAGSGEYAAAAEREMRAVIDAYGDGQGNPRVKELAARAYANLGLMYLPLQGDPDAAPKFEQAAAQYRKAIDLSGSSPPHGYYRMLGYIYGRLGQYDQADANYAEAITRADTSETRAAYAQERAALQNLRRATP